MKLDSEFIRLPLRFDAERLADEIARFDEAEWRPHPTDYQGNTALILVSSRGEQNDTFRGPMLPTPLLAQCPYIQQVLDSFQTVFGRSRLMRLASESTVPQHSDINYHWYNRVRIHVPILTYPEVRFYCNEHDVHMAPGEAWIFDTWKKHRVENPTPHTRVHLVADTAGTPEFWALVANGWRPFAEMHGDDAAGEFVPYLPGKTVHIRTEMFTHQTVMSPGEIDGLTTDLIADLDPDNPLRGQFIDLVDTFRQRWREIWSCFGVGQDALFRYQLLLRDVLPLVEAFGNSLSLTSNGVAAMRAYRARVLGAALNPDLQEPNSPAPPPAPAPVRAAGRNDPCPCGSEKKYKHCHGG